MAGNNYMIGAKFDVYDSDPSGGDEYIGRWRVNAAGTQCYTFSWEGESYQTIDNEPHPDLYVKFINTVQATSGGNTVMALDENGDEFAATSWRGVSEYTNCTGTCTNTDTHIVSSDITQYTGARMGVLDSAQHMLEVYSSLLVDDVEYWMEPCTTPDCPSTITTSKTRIKGSQDDGMVAFVAPHEMGHILQMQLFDQGFLINNCLKNGSGHDFYSEEYDSCATTEGWATYVGIVSWWDPNNSSSVPVIFNVNLEEPCQIGTCGASGTAGGYERQVAKSFWDLDDANNEDGTTAGDCDSTSDDVMSISTLHIAEGWLEFPDGITDRHDGELDAGIVLNGVNMWDHYYNNTSRYDPSDLSETTIYHNCVGNQDEN